MQDTSMKVTVNPIIVVSANYPEQFQSRHNEQFFSSRQSI